jgi:cardiolipin synthase
MAMQSTDSHRTSRFGFSEPTTDVGAVAAPTTGDPPCRVGRASRRLALEGSSRTMNSSSGDSRRLASVPNAISLVRLATVPLFVWLFTSGREDAAVLLYAVAAATDFLDGFIARRTGAVTELGKVLDPLADRIFIMALALALVARSALPAWLAIAVIARDVLVLTLWPLIERRGLRRIPVNVVGKSATALLLVGLTALALSETTLDPGQPLPGFGLAATLAGAVAYWAAAALYAREVRIRRRVPDHEAPP